MNRLVVGCAVVVTVALSHGAFAAEMTSTPCPAFARLNDGWITVAPETVGFVSAHLCAIGTAIRNGRVRNVHGVVVTRRGRLVYEEYFTGRDERWGAPTGDVTFGPETLHDIRSVTKSIVSLLYGIALADGTVPALDRPLLESFPEYADLHREPARLKILVRHALTMTMGTEWDESLPYSDPANDERRMEDATDRYRYVLDRRLVEPPGVRWNYNGGATAAIAKIVARGTGRPLMDFAKERLLTPLGITDVDWVTDGANEPIAASGLRLRPRDIAKIGQLVLNRGRWRDRQIVPASWIEESTKAHIPAEQPITRYGYFWWLGGSSFGDGTTPWIAGFGYGGQRLFVLPEHDVVVVVVAGNYRVPDAWRAPMAVLNQFVLPALAGAPRE